MRALEEIESPRRLALLIRLQGGAISFDGSGCTALVAAFYPGELGGEAIASILFGEVAPAGRLPVTVYNATWADRRAPTDMQLGPHTIGGSIVPGATYWYANAQDVLFPFGFGLSYTEWSAAWAGGFAGNVSVDAADWAANRTSPVFSAVVRNAGSVPSSLVVLGFVSSGVLNEPLSKLFDFSRLPVTTGGSTATVALSVPADVAALVTSDGTRVLTPGLYAVHIGGDASGSTSAITLHGWLTVTGSAVVLDALPW